MINPPTHPPSSPSPCSLAWTPTTSCLLYSLVSNLFNAGVLHKASFKIAIPIFFPVTYFDATCFCKMQNKRSMSSAYLVIDFGLHMQSPEIHRAQSSACTGADYTSCQPFSDVATISPLHWQSRLIVIHCSKFGFVLACGGTGSLCTWKYFFNILEIFDNIPSNSKQTSFIIFGEWTHCAFHSYLIEKCFHYSFTASINNCLRYSDTGRCQKSSPQYLSGWPIHGLHSLNGHIVLAIPVQYNFGIPMVKVHQ